MLTEALLSLMLSCTGSSVGMGTTSTGSAVASNNYGERVSVYGSTQAPVEVSGTVDVRIKDGLAEVLVPAAFLGGVGGAKWRKVKNLTITDQEISGKVGLGLLSSTVFRIDRRTGTMRSNGGFVGQCKKVDETQRAF